MLGDRAGALADNPSLIPARALSTKRNLIDLTPFYNALLDRGTFHPMLDPKDVRRNTGNDIPNLRPGEQVLAGVSFDVRGIIQLGSKIFVDYPERAEHIPIGLKAQALHFLHSTAMLEPVDTIVATYIVHYRGGQHAEIPVRYGSDLWDWFMQESYDTAAVLAWQGANARWNNTRLYKTAWNNPQPETEIESIDLVSTMTDCAVFVLGITAEE
jgi:hypothetical protein